MVPDFFTRLSSFANSTWPSMRIGHSVHGYDESTRCSNPDGFVDNSDCPEEEPHCNCPCQELIPKKETVFFDKTEKNDKYKVLDEDGNDVQSFDNPSDAYNWILENGTNNPRPTEDEIKETKEALSECDLIEEHLGSDWLGCDWEYPESEINCACPCTNPKFKDYLEYNRTYATYWDTPKHTPLYRNMLMRTIGSKKATMTTYGDFSLKSGDIIKINTELFIETELPNIKYTGKWLVAYIHHIILRGSHLMELGLVRDSNVIEPSGNYFDGINFKYQQ